MRTLSKDQILLLHQQLIEATGGSPGLRDESLLESALAAPYVISIISIDFMADAIYISADFCYMVIPYSCTCYSCFRSIRYTSAVSPL